jgi:hypothetical protein
VLAALAPELVEVPGAFVELHAALAVALEVALDPHEDLGVHRLRAGVAAPQAARHGGEQEQRVGADHQQRRQVDQVLRVQHQAEDVEAPRHQVEQHRLAVVPQQPGQAVEQDLRRPDQGPAPLDEQPVTERA